MGAGHLLDLDGLGELRRLSTVNNLRNKCEILEDDMWDIIAVVAVYFILVQFVFPKLGVPT